MPEVPMTVAPFDGVVVLDGQPVTQSQGRVKSGQILGLLPTGKEFMGCEVDQDGVFRVGVLWDGLLYVQGNRSSNGKFTAGDVIGVQPDDDQLELRQKERIELLALRRWFDHQDGAEFADGCKHCGKFQCCKRGARILEEARKARLPRSWVEQGPPEIIEEEGSDETEGATS